MNDTSVTARVVRTINGTLTFLLMVFLLLMTLDAISIQDVALFIDEVKAQLVQAKILTGVAAFLVLAINVYYLYSTSGTARYETHLRSKTEDGEVSVAVRAVENTLERAVRGLAEISDVNVEVLKEKKDENGTIRVRTTVISQEKTKFKEVVQHVQSILKERWSEIIEPESEPYFEIVLGGVAEQSAGSRRSSSSSGTSKGKEGEDEEDPYLYDTFSGPKYPVEEEEETS